LPNTTAAGGGTPHADDEAPGPALLAHPHGPAEGLGQVGEKDGDEQRQRAADVFLQCDSQRRTAPTRVDSRRTDGYLTFFWTFSAAALTSILPSLKRVS
jgi:hypothetical protein